MSIRIAVNGAGGRMGQRIMTLALNDPELELVAARERAGHPLIGKAITEIVPMAKAMTAVSTQIVGKVAVVIDFSAPEALEDLLEETASKNVPLVIGTTGLGAEGESRIQKAAKMIPIVYAPNMSLGVNLMFRLCRELAGAIGQEYDIEITESHHNRKADAPSGTAMGLARVITEVLGLDPDHDLVHGRQGRPGPRTKKEIGMHALRLGNVVGEHTVHFASDYERIEITHKAQDRDVFAAGALRAAKWVVGRRPGLFSMEDVLFGG